MKLLVESGANVNSANSMGQTCLMIACKKGHFATVKYLLEKGADLNRKTDKGKDAFDECKSDPIMDVLRLMSVERMNQERIDVGMNLLQLAAVNGHQDTVEHIIRYTELVGKQKEIDALELLGAALIEDDDDDDDVPHWTWYSTGIQGAKKLWKKAMEERYEGGVLVRPKSIINSPVSAYNNMLEVKTMLELEQISSEPDMMWMQALLVRERILGPANPYTGQFIQSRGREYAKRGNFNRCISLWMYGLDIQEKYLKPLSFMTHVFLFDFIELFCNKMTDEQLLERFGDIMMVLRRAVNEVHAGHDAQKAYSYIFHETILKVLVLVCCLTKLIPHLEKEKVHEIKQVVHSFVMIGAKGQGGTSPLHLACRQYPEALGPTCHFPSLDTINLLLECGEPIDTKDNNGNTALHIAALNKPVAD